LVIPQIRKEEKGKKSLISLFCEYIFVSIHQFYAISNMIYYCYTVFLAAGDLAAAI
jgi:hypothetical protein